MVRKAIIFINIPYLNKIYTYTHLSQFFLNLPKPVQNGPVGFFKWTGPFWPVGTFFDANFFFLFFIYFQTSINGARKLRFERMTPIRKGREKTEVTATRVQPGSRRIQNCEKKKFRASKLPLKFRLSVRFFFIFDFVLFLCWRSYK